MNENLTTNDSEQQQAPHLRLINKAKAFAIGCHEETNHLYGEDLPYSHHLQMVYDFGLKYYHLLPENDRAFALAACWTHDTIEDCRQTYNDIKNHLGVEVAEITYALTNEKGKNRKERANDKYYSEMKKIPAAVFVKICDRLANVKHSKNTGSRMIEAYRKEYEAFSNQLMTLKFVSMFQELHELL
jgi:(p)ppGpp synthase/HD superfamily hydrolase